MIDENRVNRIATLLVTSYDFPLEESHSAVMTFISDNPEEIDDDLSDEEAAELVYEYSD